MGADLSRSLRHCAVAMLVAGYAVSSSGAVASKSEPPGAAAQATAPHGTTWLIFLDDLHLDFRNTGRLQVLLETMASELIHEGDELGIIRSSHPAPASLRLTSDRRLLEAVARSTNALGLNAADTLLYPDAALAAREVRYRASVALATARETLTPAAPGRRKAVIYVSNGYALGLGAARFHDRLSELTRLAIRSRITIFAIEPRRLVDARLTGAEAALDTYRTTARNSLRALSEPTGGFLLVDGPDLVEDLNRINSAMRH
jgi:VWFA-related protein